MEKTLGISEGTSSSFAKKKESTIGSHQIRRKSLLALAIPVQLCFFAMRATLASSKGVPHASAHKGQHHEEMLGPLEVGTVKHNMLGISPLFLLLWVTPLGFSKVII